MGGRECVVGTVGCAGWVSVMLKAEGRLKAGCSRRVVTMG